MLSANSLCNSKSITTQEVALQNWHLLCRSLVLRTPSWPTFSGLAADNLPSLSVIIPAFYMEALLSPPGIAGLRELTRLELVGEDSIGSLLGLQALRELPIQELILLNWWETQLGVLLSFPSGLPALKKLHIEDVTCAIYPHRDMQTLRDIRQQELESMLGVILQLPELCQLSGCSSLFAVGGRRALSQWIEVEFSKEAMITSNFEHVSSLPHMKTWIKPGSH